MHTLEEINKILLNDELPYTMKGVLYKEKYQWIALEPFRTKLDDLWKSNNLFFMVGAMLYWAEGRKSKNLSFCNTDTYAINFMVNWFEFLFGINKKELSISIYYSEKHQMDTSCLVNYWSENLNIDKSQIKLYFASGIKADYGICHVGLMQKSVSLCLAKLVVVFMESLYQNINFIDKDIRFFLCNTLYFCEGTKTTGIFFANTDHIMISFMLNEFFNKYNGELYVRVFLNQKHDIDYQTILWKDVLKDINGRQVFLNTYKGRAINGMVSLNMHSTAIKVFHFMGNVNKFNLMKLTTEHLSKQGISQELIDESHETIVTWKNEKTPKDFNKKYYVKIAQSKNVLPKTCKLITCQASFIPLSKTQEFCSKQCTSKYGNDKKTKIPPKDVLETLINEGRSFLSIGRQFNVSGGAVKKWTKKYGIYEQRAFKLEDKTCPVCGKIFHPLSKESINCSKKCQTESLKKFPLSKEELSMLLPFISNAEIERKYNLAHATVLYWVKKYDLAHIRTRKNQFSS